MQIYCKIKEILLQYWLGSDVECISGCSAATYRHRKWDRDLRIKPERVTEKEMRAKHRHELKTNELAEWIANLPQWAQENLRTIIYVSVVAALALGSYLYIRYQRSVVSVQEELRLTEFMGLLSQSKRDILAAQVRGIDVSYMLLRLADDLQTFAGNTKDEQRAALALIKRAEALRTELHYRPKTVSGRELADQIRLAKDSYNNAFQRVSQVDSSASVAQEPSSNRVLVAMARFGLGLCEEELGNFKQARQIYQDVAANPMFQDTITVIQAKERLETMGDYEQKVVFQKPPPRPSPRPTTPPRIPSSPPGINRATANLPDVNLILPGGGPTLPEPNAVRFEVTRADSNLADSNLASVNLPEP